MYIYIFFLNLCRVENSRNQNTQILIDGFKVKYLNAINSEVFQSLVVKFHNYHVYNLVP